MRITTICSIVAQAKAIADKARVMALKADLALVAGHTQVDKPPRAPTAKSAYLVGVQYSTEFAYVAQSFELGNSLYILCFSFLLEVEMLCSTQI